MERSSVEVRSLDRPSAELGTDKHSDTMGGMVLSLAGIALCVQSKNT